MHLNDCKQLDAWCYQISYIQMIIAESMHLNDCVGLIELGSRTGVGQLILLNTRNYYINTIFSYVKYKLTIYLLMGG